MAGNFIGFSVIVDDFDRVDDSDRANFSNVTYHLALPVVHAAEKIHSLFADNFVDGELLPCFHGDWALVHGSSPRLVALIRECVT